MIFDLKRCHTVYMTKGMFGTYVCVTLGIIHVRMSFTHKIMKNDLFKQPFN